MNTHSDTSLPLDESTTKEIDKWLRYPANRREFVRGVSPSSSERR
jgi:hypothetical protein